MSVPQNFSMVPPCERPKSDDFNSLEMPEESLVVRINCRNLVPVVIGLTRLTHVGERVVHC